MIKKYIKFKGSILIEICMSFFFLLILFKLFNFEIEYILKKKQNIKNANIYNNVCLAVNYISDRLIGSNHLHVYNKKFIFKGTKDTIIFSYFTAQKENHILKKQKLCLIYLNKRKIKLMTHFSNIIRPKSFLLPKTLCTNVSKLHFSYHTQNMQCFINKIQKSFPTTISITINIKLFKHKAYMILKNIRISILK